MGADWTGKKAAKEIEKLDQERLKTWDRIVALEDAVKELKKIPENSARHQLRKTTEVRNKAEEKLKEVENVVERLKREADAGAVNARAIDAARVAASSARQTTAEEAEKTKALTESLQAKLDNYDSFSESHPDFETELDRLEAILNGSESQYSKLSQIVKNAESRRKEIIDKHHEVFGFEQEDEDGVKSMQPGLVDELEEAYSELATKLEASSAKIASAVKHADDAAKRADELLTKGAEDQLAKRASEFETTQRRIESLLPGALASGLADAYAKKVKEEEKDRDKHRSEFSQGIWIMLAIAVIPVILSVVFLRQGVELYEVIERLPKIALATLFLYVAAVWKTGAAGRRQRLSKRLIEEYSHKEAQSRTFVGLSKQIADLGDDDLSRDLKLKLLHNLVQVSSENPGKLISDYRKSDHPIYELSEQSAKLATAIEKVKRVPGGDYIAEILQGRRTQIKKSIDAKALEGLAAVTETVTDEQEEEQTA